MTEPCHRAGMARYPLDRSRSFPRLAPPAGRRSPSARRRTAEMTLEYKVGRAARSWRHRGCSSCERPLGTWPVSASTGPGGEH
eukprot:scaffold1786_cov398-Prasinococcus_capsulatus_cf.AAC.4